MSAAARRLVKGEKASEDEASSDNTDGWIKGSDESSSDEASSSEVTSSSDEVSDGSEYVDDGSDDGSDDDDDDDDDGMSEEEEAVGTDRGAGKDGDGDAAQRAAEAPVTAPGATALAPKAAMASGDDVDDIFTEEAFAAPTVARKRLMKKGC